MFKTIQGMLAIAASVAIPCAMAQTMSSDQQIITPKPVPKMTAEEKKADKAAKRAPAAAPKPGTTSTMSSDQQVTTMKPVPKMTAEEKKADKAAKRKAPTPEEQAKQSKQTPGG